MIKVPTQKIIENENKDKNIKLDESMEEKICNSFDKIIMKIMKIRLKK